MSEQQEFDYVIVGAGSAGCVLANRLSADPKNRVCLLEAGPRDWNPFIRMPVGVIVLMWGKMFNWGYRTTAQPQLNNREMFWPRGKTLGGSSSVNAQCYTRGNAWDYDHWAELGNRGWGYADMLPYFRKSEKYEAGGDMQYHGSEGGYHVSELKYKNPLSHAFVKAAQEAGYQHNEDFGGATEEGFGFYDVAQTNGERCSNARAFLHPVAERENLTVITRAQATRVLFENKRATGVEYKKGRWGGLREVRAAREVILCGGAINSPQLLLLSGVGADEELSKHGIAPVHPLPGVGKNLQDHLDVSLICKEKTRHSISLRPDWVLLKGIPALFNYIFRREGILASNVAEAGGFARINESDELCSLQLHFIPAVEQDHGHNLWNTFKYYGVTARVCDLRPFSRGEIGLNSADPLAHARIEPNYLAHERDLDNLVSGLKVVRDIFSQAALNSHLGDEIEPGEHLQTDEQLRAYVRARAETIYHPVGTCKMGHDEMAVVDDRLRVHGLQGLRVIDASVMPTLVGGNTNAPTTAIAEKGAEMILEDQQAPQQERAA